MSTVDKPTIYTQGLRRFQVVQRVTYEQQFAGFVRAVGHPIPGDGYFARSVVVIQAPQALKQAGQAQVRYRFLQVILFAAGDNRLAHFQLMNAPQHLAAALAKRAFGPAQFVSGNKFGADHFERLRPISQLQVIICYGKSKYILIPAGGERRHVTPFQQAVHQVKTEPGIIQQGSVPVPNNMFIGPKIYIHEPEFHAAPMETQDQQMGGATCDVAPAPLPSGMSALKDGRNRENRPAGGKTPPKSPGLKMGPAARGGVSADDYIPKLSPEDQARFRAVEEQVRQVRELAAVDPEAMGRLLQVWLAQGRSEPADKAAGRQGSQSEDTD